MEPLASVTTAQWALRSARAVGVVTGGRFSATFMFAVFMAVVFVNSTNNLATFRGSFSDFAMFVVELERPNASDTGEYPRTALNTVVRVLRNFLVPLWSAPSGAQNDSGWSLWGFAHHV